MRVVERSWRLRFDFAGVDQIFEFCCGFTVIICRANVFLSSSLTLSRASLLDLISNMSLIAASVTKSWVDGARPINEFMPIFRLAIERPLGLSAIGKSIIQERSAFF
jgi:hypothetical protein